MPAVYPFRAVQYNRGAGDVSTLVAPPYDVLDAKSKSDLLARNDRNIVAIDLPHTPAKELGPPATYDAAGQRFRQWLEGGTLSRRDKPAMFAYRQTFMYGQHKRQRCGMAAAINTVPFGPAKGGGILPHEETFSGPKEDRLALMRATKAQLSPIFGLHPDEHGTASGLVRTIMDSRKPTLTARMADGVLHEVWPIDDQPTLDAYTKALEGEDIFIADGHHRYNTALNYLKELESKGAVPADHPARRCMMVLIGMSDPGLVIGPTHRVLGGMKNYSIEKFLDAAKGMFRIVPGPPDPDRLEEAMLMEAPTSAPGLPDNVFGLIDFATGKTFVATLATRDPLFIKFPDKPKAWRLLDVALVQYAMVEGICQPKLSGGDPVKWAFPHSIAEVVEIGKGKETGAGGGAGFAQLAVIVRPTPLEAVRDISRANVLMPQKSTFFLPKLATGLFLNMLE